MLSVIITSALVSFVVARVVVRISFVDIDRYVEETIDELKESAELLKKFTNANKQP